MHSFESDKRRRAQERRVGAARAPRSTDGKLSRVRLQEEINRLGSKLQAELQKAKERREAAQREAQAKVELLQAKAAAAKAKAAEKHIEL
jgi:hypothetical protein